LAISSFEAPKRFSILPFRFRILFFAFSAPPHPVFVPPLPPRMMMLFFVFALLLGLSSSYFI
jgi:hypothetical protein